MGLRRKEDLNLWKKRDPIGRLETGLLNEKLITASKINIMNKKIEEIVKSAWSKAMSDPYPDLSQLVKTVYFEG